MPNKTGYIQKFNPHNVSPTRFEIKWGEPAYKIAEREDVATTSIHMRVRNYNNPYQRKAKPSFFEAKYGKTIVEICHELYLHPVALVQREKIHNNVYIEDTIIDTNIRNVKREAHKHTKHWTKLAHYSGDRFWLMPEHPLYLAQRNLALQWDCGKHIALARQKVAK